MATTLSQYFSATLSMMEAMSRRAPFEETLTATLQNLTKLGFLRPHISVLDAAQDSLNLSLTADGQTLSRHAYVRGVGVTGTVLNTGKCSVLPRIKDYPDFLGHFFDRTREEEKSLGFICVPIFECTERTESESKRVIGTLSADIPDSSPEELEERCGFLEITAGLIGHNVAYLQEDLARREAHYTRGDTIPLPCLPDVIAQSKSMNHVLHHALQVAPSRTTVLLRGESGSGKELMASVIHRLSPRRDKPFIKLNCAALPTELVESELFGWQKGAFTGAQSSRRGLFEQADQGTLFLDEIGDLSLSAQAKVLRAIQESEITRLGSESSLKVDVRLICASHQPLEQLIEQKLFREDLYYRINVFSIFIPPLRDRREDIAPLSNAFLQKYSEEYDRPAHGLSVQAEDMLRQYRWPGNVRELQNVIERAVLLCNENILYPDHFPPALRLTEKNIREELDEKSFQGAVEAFEKRMLCAALKKSKGNIHAAARAIGLTYRIFYYKLNKYGVNFKDYSGQASHVD